MKSTRVILAGACLLSLAQFAQAQRQLLCEEGQQCSINCYQDGMDSADRDFQRDKIETLQIDLAARVLKIEFRGQPEKPTAFDYFILGSEMSCTIENMRGVHD
jgi:hypothetical protein